MGDIGKLEVSPEEIQNLLEYFARNTYKARDSQPKVQQIMQKCLGLFGMDYNYSVISNMMGELSTNYPSSLVILESEKGMDEHKDEENGTSSANDENGGSSCNGTPRDDGVVQVTVEGPSSDAVDGNKGGIDLLLESESFIGTSLPSTPFVSNVGNGNGNGNCYIVSGNNRSYEGMDVPKLKDLCSRARFARCRARFPVSVILYKKTHICRSATLSGGPEIYGRSSFDYFFSGGADNKQYNEIDTGGDEEIIVPETQSDWQLFDRVRSQDIRLLRSFQVHTIVDLMVEKKKVKFGVNVTSSEKVDKENRYAEFNLISLPYPGCEFFRDYRDNGYNAEDLVFEWNQGHVDANICVPEDPVALSLDTDWNEYRKWDLVTLTQKYLKLLLAYLKSGDKGLLVHCISGWDRTPLFVSLLRLSLWADGVIHKSLSAEQILYLTLAYDWLLFGHNLEDRLSKGEEIMFFCFYFLKYIIEPEYSVEEGVSTSPQEVPEPEVPKEPPVVPQETMAPAVSKPEPQERQIRVRNDSDIQLDGVLLEGGECHTSPEGSNWSLSSVESSHSSRSQDNPPCYFQLPQDSSWEDFKAQDLLGRHRHCSSHSNPSLQNFNIAQNLVRNNNNHHHSNSNGVESCVRKNRNENSRTATVISSLEPMIEPNYASGAATVTRTSSSPSVHSNGVLVCPSSSSPPSGSSGLGSAKHSSSSSSTQSPLAVHSSEGSSVLLTSGNPEVEVANGSTFYSPGTPSSKLERTSPVAVPASRVHHRPESTSSASIGSWQLVTDPGSLRENISSSDPGSNSSHSNNFFHRPPRNSGIPPDCIETSESSCTLVEELNQAGMQESVDSLAESVIAVPEPRQEPVDMTDSVLGLERLEITTDPLRMKETEWKELQNKEDQMEESIVTIPTNLSLTMTTSISSEFKDGTPTNISPTQEKECSVTDRREKLQTVRAHFYTLYASAIGFKFKNVNDNGSSGGGGGGSGFGFFIGNLLGSSKIGGGRTVNRTTNV